MAEVKNNILNNNLAGDTSNILVPDTSAIKNGIDFKSNINSNVLNGYYNLLSEAVQFLQFTAGLYSEEANYDEGNIASLVIKNGEDYSIWQFRRNANNPQVLNNNPPITGASITTVNGVDAYEGGSLNTDWDKLTEDYAADAAPNTVMGRDSEGASNVNMPSSITNTSIVNNQYLQQQLQAGLSTKQDTLTAGTNITIEDNVISASGDLATKAELVTYDNSNTNLEYISGYDFPKFKVEIPTYNLVLTDGTSDFNAAISKQGDESYLLSGVLENFNITNANEVDIQIKSVNNIDISKFQSLFSILAQFFELGNIYSPEYIESQENEVNIQDNNNFQFCFILNSEPIYFALRIKSTSPLNTAPSTITLNIKNRVLKPSDVYIHYLDLTDGIMKNIQLTQNNNSVKYIGEYIGFPGTFAQINFYSDLDMSNYFNLVSNYYNLNSTTGITSSSGKAVKFGIQSISSIAANTYALYIVYEDGSSISEGDIFTFNLTPDKNSALDPVYSEVTNVQQMGEVLASRYLLPCYYEQLTDDNGNFLEEEEPANWYKRLYNLDTVWELIHNTKSIVYRTEGTKASISRVNGLQPYGVEQLIGNFYSGFSDNGPVGMFSAGDGVFTASIPHPTTPLYQGGERTAYRAITFDSAKIIKSYTNDLVMDNFPVRKWKLKSINGVLVKDLLGK